MTNLQQIEQNELWDYLKQFYKEKFGMEPGLVDIMADIDILRLCATGASTKSIVSFLNLEPEIVEDVLDKYFGFKGWINDLQINPLAIYKHPDNGGFRTLQEFSNYMTSVYGYVDMLETIYNCVVVTDMLERLLDEKWI